ncbi:MAG: serine/threonine protein kinase [Gemmatimonadetes bacterium]|nr:serine/threonine protein kinase [Gemmatimonadota bacterium]
MRSAGELEEVLRQRLRLMAILPAVGLTVLMAVGLAVSWRRYVAAPAELFTRVPYYGILALVTLSCSVVAILMSPRRRSSLARLRTMEWVGFAPVVVLFAFVLTLSLRKQLADLADHVWYFAMATSLTWGGVMVQYGVFIPNSGRRCAAAMGLIAMCAMLPDAVLLANSSVDGAAAWTYLAVKLQFLGYFAALAIYGSHRIDVLQKDANEARMLGQYVLKRQIGSGGMGEVHLAEHRFLRRPCAVKLVRVGGEADAQALARFEREVQVTATLTHPNAVQIFDYGHAEDGTFFYAMEYLPGLSLEELVDRHGPLPAERVTHILAQLCGALREAHGLGLIHRDIKPGNVIICERGGTHDVAKLLDFGLVAAFAADVAESRITQDGLLLGTPAFMSPEQCGGVETLGPASDLYGLGAVAYFLLTGKVLFPGRSPMQMLAAHLYEMPLPMATHGVSVPADLEAIVFRCLAKQPSERFPDAAQLEAALRDRVASVRWTEQRASAWWREHGGVAGVRAATT